MDQQLHPMQIDMVKRYVTAIGNTGCKYFIILPSGEELKNFEAVEKQNGSRGRLSARETYGHGFVSTYIKSHLKDTLPGKMGYVPYGGFDHVMLRANASSACHHMWGKGSYRVEPGDKGDEGFFVLREAETSDDV